MAERIDGPEIMQKLAYERFSRGISIRNVAMEVGMAPETLIHYEKGLHPAPFWAVEAICDVLGFKILIKNREGKVVYESFGPR